VNNKNSSKSVKERNLLVICLVLLSVFLLVTLFRTSFHSVDVAVNLWTPTIRSGALTFFAEGVALIFDTTSLVLLSLVLSGMLFLRNLRAQGLLLLGAMGGDALLVSIIKTLDHVARPTNGILPDTGFSYPSGHSAGCIVFVGVLAYFAWHHWQSTRSRVLIGASMGVVASVVGFDRVYLGVHWLSDVFGGWLFGAFWLSFAVLVFRQLEAAGKLNSDRFNTVAVWLFVAAVVIAVLVVLLGLFGFSLP
jgi:membrane-associated phospholipid phosphatase